MAGLLYDANNVVVGNAALYTKPWSATTPAVLLDDDTPLWDVTAWETAGWESAGATNEGFKVTADTSTTTVTIEEQSIPVAESVDAKSLSIEADLAESTMKSMQMAWGGGTIVSTAAASGVPGTQKMTLTSGLVYVAAVLEMKNFHALPRRIFIPKMSLFGSGETSFRRSSDKQMFPIKMTSLCPPEDVEIVDIVAPALP